MQIQLRKLIFLFFLIWQSWCSCLKKPFVSAHIEGEWKQAIVLEPLGPCEPCRYSLDFDHQSANFQIYNEKQPDLVYKFELIRQADQKQLVYLDRAFNFVGQGNVSKSYQIKINVSSQPKDGAIFYYIIQASEIGLYIEDNTRQNKYSLIARTVIFAMILWLFIPVNKNSVQKSVVEMHKRTCLFSLYLYSQLILTISLFQAILTFQFVMNETSSLFKIVWYCLMGFTALSCIVHAIYSIAIVQKKLNDYLREGQYKFVMSFLSLFLGLILYPLFLTLFHKGIWYFYFISTGIILQFFISKITKTMPYKKFILLYSIFIVHLALQTDQYSILNFNQLSYISIAGLIGYLVLVNLGGAWFLRNVGNLENIANMFGMNVRQKQRPSQSTQQEYQYQKKMKNDETQKNTNHMKSEIQMQHTFE